MRDGQEAKPLTGQAKGSQATPLPEGDDAARRKQFALTRLRGQPVLPPTRRRLRARKGAMTSHPFVRQKLTNF